ncbi:MAG: Gfo/Idh/MocA family protein [Armatimonadota bacterium]
MATQQRYGFGVIGCGVISGVHTSAIEQIPEAKLVAVCDMDEEKAKSTAEQHGVDWHTDMDEMLARDDIHVVNILTWSGHHHVAGVAAAEAGKHVICTKPIDITLEAIDSLIAACDENNVKLAATHQLRSDAAYRRMKQAVDEGRLGKLLYGNAFIPWYRSQEYYDDAWHGTRRWDGGALMNQSIHWIDVLLWIMGRVASVCGYVDALAHRIEVEDIGTAALKFENGAHGLIQGTTLTYHGMPTRIEIHGTKGNAVAVADGITLWDVEGEEVEAGEAPDDPTGAADPTSGLELAVDAHVDQISDVLRAIEEDRAPMIDGPEARRAVEVILAIYKTGETGEPVTLPLKS